MRVPGLALPPSRPCCRALGVFGCAPLTRMGPLPAALAYAWLFGFASLRPISPVAPQFPFSLHPRSLSPQVWRTLGPFCEVNVVFALFCALPFCSHALTCSSSTGLGPPAQSPGKEPCHPVTPSPGPILSCCLQTLPSPCADFPAFFSPKSESWAVRAAAAVPCSSLCGGHGVSCHTLVLWSRDMSHVLCMDVTCLCRNGAVSGQAGLCTFISRNPSTDVCGQVL